MQLILENTFDGIALIQIPANTQNRKLLMCNDRYVEMAGRSRQELMAADDIMTFVRNNQRPGDYESLVRNGLPVLGTASWIRPDGKENIFEWLSMWVRADGETFIVAVDRDITDRVRTERTLRSRVTRTELSPSLSHASRS